MTNATIDNEVEVETKLEEIPSIVNGIMLT